MTRSCCRCRNMRRRLSSPQRFIMPAINPFSTTNKELTEEEIDGPAGALRDSDRPAAGGAGLPLRQVEGSAGRDRGLPDRPQGGGRHAGAGRQRRHRRSRKARKSSNRCAAAAKSGSASFRCRTPPWSTPCSAARRSSCRNRLREGFGLTVTEAMWKGAAVIGGNVGGIQAPDRGRRERLSGRQRRGGGGPHRRAAEGPSAAQRHGPPGARDPCASVS